MNGIPSNINQKFSWADLPIGWYKSNLEEIALINPKKTKSKANHGDAEVSFVPMKSVGELTGRIDLSNTRKYKDCSGSYTYFENGDIIFAKITPCMENGKIAIVSDLKNGIGFGSTEFHVIRFFGDAFDKKFYFYYLLQDIYRSAAQNSMKGTAGQLRVPAAYLKNSLVPVPPLAEQRRIVARIESIFARIDAARGRLERLAARGPDAPGSLAALRASTLKAAFEGRLVPQDPRDESAHITLDRILPSIKQKSNSANLPTGWGVCALEEIALINPKKPKSKTIDNDTKVSFVPMKSVEELTGKIDVSNIRKRGDCYSGYTYFENNDIIFAKITPCMENGKIAIASGLKNGIGFGSTEFHVIRFVNNIFNKKFYFYYLLQDRYRSAARNNMKGTAGQLRVPAAYLKNTLVPIPPLAEQRRIVARLESILGGIDSLQMNKNPKAVCELSSLVFLHVISDTARSHIRILLAQHAFLRVVGLICLRTAGASSASPPCGGTARRQDRPC